MHKKTPDEESLQLGDKTIRFIPIVHFGRKEFYEKLKQKITAYKQQGYVVYYEQVKTGYAAQGISRESYDTLRLKYRKMKNGQGYSRKDYEKELKGIFKNKTVQPLYDSLGITATDVNADVSLAEFTAEYERRNGKIILDSCDLHTPPGSAYVCKGLPRGNMRPVIEDFRNEQLVKRLRSAAQQKILVIYGAAHIKPVKKMLQQP